MTKSHERLRYFDGRLLTGADFQTEQDYFRERLRRHNRLLHGWGVVCGLEVAASPTAREPRRLIVAPGLALSPQGDEICVPEPAVFVIDAEAYESPAPCLAIRYAENPKAPVPALGGKEVEPSRIEESFVLALLPGPPASQAKAKASDLAWAKAARAALAQAGAPLPPPPLPDPTDEPWVALATVRLRAPKKPGAPVPALVAADLGFADRRVILDMRRLALLAGSR